MPTRLKAAVGRTYNTGNYESIRIDVSIEEDIPEGVHTDVWAKGLFQEALASLNEDAKYLGLKETRHP